MLTLLSMEKKKKKKNNGRMQPTARPLVGFLQCNGGKLEESEGFNYVFFVSCVLESK